MPTPAHDNSTPAHAHGLAITISITTKEKRRIYPPIKKKARASELRHRSRIARSVSEDSLSCPSSRDISPSSRKGGTIGRVPPSPNERRLPTFVGLSTGNTPKRRAGGGARSFSSPGLRNAYGKHGRVRYSRSGCTRRAGSFLFVDRPT